MYKHGKPLGVGMPTISSAKQSKQSLIQKMISYNRVYQRLSLDSMGADIAYEAIKTLYKKSGSMHKDVYVAIVSHPKVFTGEAFDNLELFIRKVEEQGQKVDFMSLADVYHRSFFIEG